MHCYSHGSGDRFSAVRTPQSFKKSIEIAFLSAVFGILCFLPLSVAAETEGTSPNEEASSPAGGITGFEITEEEFSTSEASLDDPETTDQLAQTESDEAVSDETVTIADLEVDDASILQDSPLYSLKRLGRSLRKVFTFNNKKKFDLEIRYANQELADIKKLIETKGEQEKSFEEVTEAIKRFEEGMGKAKDSAGKVAKGGDESSSVVEETIDKQIKQQKLLEQVEKNILDHAPKAITAQVVEKIQNTKEDIAAHAAETISGIETNPERLAGHIDRALQKQRGSEFRELRNLEVLKRVEYHVPEQARGAIREAQENSLKRFAEHTGQSQEEERSGRFEEYVRHIGGDETRHMEIFDRLKQRDDLPENLRKKIEVAKDITANKFKEKLERFESEFNDENEAVRARFRERAFARFQAAPMMMGGRIDPDDRSTNEFFPAGPPPEELIERLRVLDDIRQRVEFDHEEVEREFEAREKESIEQFKNTFTDDESQNQVGRFEQLSRKMAENPDPSTFRLLRELEEKVKADPKKREFLERMEREAKSQFVQKAQEKGEKFFEQVISSNPQDIEIFKRLQEEFANNPEAFFAPPGIGPDGFGPPPFGPDGEFLPLGVGPEGFGPPPFGPDGFDPSSEFNDVFDQVIDRQTAGLAEHVKNIDDPELFEHFQRKFQQGSGDVIEEFRRRGGNFEDVYRDKFRMINERSLQEQRLEEQQHVRLEEEQLEIESEFERRRMESSDDPETLRRLEEERMLRERDIEDRRIELQKASFEKRLQLDPFCDARCQEEEKRHFESIIMGKQQLMRDMMEGMDFPGGFNPDGFSPPPEFEPGIMPVEFSPDQAGVQAPNYPASEFFGERDSREDARIDNVRDSQRIEPQPPRFRVIDGVHVPPDLSEDQASEFVKRERERITRQREEQRRSSEIKESGLEQEPERKPESTFVPKQEDTQFRREYEELEAERRKEDQIRFDRPEYQYFPESTIGSGGEIRPPEHRENFSGYPSDNFSPPDGFPTPPDGQSFSSPPQFGSPPGDSEFAFPPEVR